MRRLKEDIYQQARKRVAKKKRWIKELFAYGMAVAICIFINAATGGPPWFIWVAGPWGIIILFRGLSLWSGKYIDRWEERAMQDEIEQYSNSMLRSHHFTDDDEAKSESISPDDKDHAWDDREML